MNDPRDAGAGPMDRRRAGVLLHPTSLPGPHGHGDLGPDAHRFVDWLAEAGATVWQMLPVVPTGDDGSPYHGLSAHAGNPHLVALEPLAEAGWLDEGALGEPEGDARAWRRARLRDARTGFRERAAEADREAYRAFVDRHAHWLDDYALFAALREAHDGAPWWDWPAPLRDRQQSALDDARARLAPAVEQARFEQYLFFSQWAALRRHAREQGVLLFGDLPIFVAHDSAEVWAHRELFALDGQGRAEVVAGVPPDYFSATGQRWGNPLYRWDRMAADGYRWWTDRLGTQLELFDWIRVDHFRGFHAHWEIPAEAETGETGRWVDGPGEAIFEAFREALGALPLVAEDLGTITPEVHALRERLGLPGMKVLQFGFHGGADNPHPPHAHRPDFVVFTGTHDNNTTVGWWHDELDDAGREHVHDYLGRPDEPMPWPLIRAALRSPARVAILPMQDVLELGGEHRMNTPGTTTGNWQWRFDWARVPGGHAAWLRHLIGLYGRL